MISPETRDRLKKWYLIGNPIDYLPINLLIGKNSVQLPHPYHLVRFYTDGNEEEAIAKLLCDFTMWFRKGIGSKCDKMKEDAE